MKSNPLLPGLLGLLAGALAGAGVFAALRPAEEPEIRTEVVKQQLTPEELANLCSDEVQDERQALQEAQSKVVDLQSQLASREQELADLEAQAEKDASKKAAAAQRYKELQAEVESLRSRLTQAEQERDTLVVELKKTVAELEDQIKQTEVQRQRAERYKSESHVNLWSSFSNEAKVEICDRGTRRRHEKCHEAVEGALTPQIREQFLTCVNTWQFTPTLRQLEDRKAAIPAHAVKLSDDDRFTEKGWYIQFCDPSLPEAPEGGVQTEGGEDRNATPAPTLQPDLAEPEGE